MNRREPRRISKAGFLLPLPTTEDRAQNNASGAPNATSFCTRCPEGTNENRPAFQRRVEVWETSVPKGRLKRPLQTSLRDSVHVLRCPGVETPGYCQTSLRDIQTEKLVALGVLPAEESYFRRFRSGAHLCQRGRWQYAQQIRSCIESQWINSGALSGLRHARR